MSHSLPRRYFKKLASNFISLVSGFIVTSIVPRALGPLEYGKFSFITDIFSQIFLLLEGGSSNALYNKLSQDPQNVFLLKKYTKFLILTNILVFSGLIVSFAFDFSNSLFAHIEIKFIIMGGIYASLFWLNSIYVKALDGLGMTSKMEQQRIYMSILRAASIISLFYVGQITLVFFFISQILLVLLLNLSFLKLIGALSKNYLPILNKDIFGYFYRYSRPLFIYGIISAAATIADRWLLQKYSGLSQQGYFSLASQLGAICFLFSSSLTPLFQREIAITSHNADLEGSHRLIYKSFPILFFIAATLGIFCSINSLLLVKVVAGQRYVGDNLAYALMFLYPIHQTYGQLASSIYYASGETKIYKNIGMLLLTVGIMVSFFLLAPAELFGLNLGFKGVAIKNVALQLFNVHILLYFAFKKLKVPIAPFMLNQVTTLVLLGMGAIFSQSVSGIFIGTNSISNLFLNGIIYICTITILIYVCYKARIPIFMRYTNENIEFVLTKLGSIRNYFRQDYPK